ncbi:amino acid ABC transporter substrate-binding protein [Pseudomonas edaphica]|jgi:polar amino acid transport system substrate-binding protein|uniref:Amino acid ABC transporter substrate-binding protein n=1 Tax=Pseudomonas edaphica TaxID=2006980 RepID=A0A5R8R6V3_9PSED|nr:MULTISPECIES: transporter substrate-binding domain-containing protein [Pseudomonas]MCF5230829.1 transporter substrate-binding domain-containing protein [Pseudomonas sp. PA-5-4H]MCF5234930.1 transporter substrate-binding domain-containing protein [Pseudomonas sp. PA-5-4G]MCF5247180.1 transporter substrate-binding domain-containing protein [Pseudomonas sp. PA-5-4B]MCF5254036.1 transporter substrate-binding domain-containing protein [Pseudomonas sp. PA-5-4B]MCF5260532.1 transporter substrate-b
MPVILKLLTAVLFACLSFTAYGEKLRVVTEPWAPYVYDDNGSMRGLDYETTMIVFQRLGVEVEWQFLPWKRCLAMLDQGHADGALDIFHSHERDALLLYPSEPLSAVEFVLFYANDRPHPAQTLDGLRGLTVGTSPGYLYGEAFSESSLFDREPAPSHEANFGKLSLGRIDLVITDRRVGQHVIKAMGLEGKVSQAPLVVSRQPQFLAVRRGAGMDLLVQRFAAELKRFKQEPAYAALSAKYGGIQANTAPEHTVEQQESGAP